MPASDESSLKMNLRNAGLPFSDGCATHGQQVPTLRLLFQVARRGGAWAAIDHPALGLEVLSVLRLVIPSCFNIYIEEFFLYYNQLNLIV